MANLEVQHSMQDTSLMSEDRYVNTFHVSTVGLVDDALLTFIRGQIQNFYFAPSGYLSTTINDFLSKQVTGAGTTVKIYDLDGPAPHPPLHSFSYEMAVTTTTGSYPSEVASCVTLKADPVAGIPSARLRGRLYIGPLNTNAGEAGISFKSRPGISFQNTVVNAVKTLQGALQGHTPRCSLQVYSPTIRGAAPSATTAMHSVTSASMDDAWDTQRRRGCDPTGKVSIAIPPV